MIESNSKIVDFKSQVIIFTTLFLLILPIEFSFEIVGVRFTPLRLFLIVIFPMLAKEYLFTFNSRPKFLDSLLFTYLIWCLISFFINHRFAQALQSGGILFLEVMSAYFIGQLYISKKTGYYFFCKLIYIIFFLMFIASIFEATSGVRFIHDLSSSITGNYYYFKDELRFGLLRAAGSFEHQILLGSFFTLTLPILWSYRKGIDKSLPVYFWFAPLLALSSAPILMLFSSILIMIYFKMNWNEKFSLRKVLVAFFIFYIFVELYTNSSALTAFIRIFTLDPQTGYFRILIWDFATEVVKDNLFFGIGLNDWARPFWMPPSIDSYWLVNAVRFGLFNTILLLFFFISIFYELYRLLKNHDIEYRKKLNLISSISILVGIIFIGFTVHLWGIINLYIFIILGCMVSWINDEKTKK
ncbi:hypothetical protein WNY63_07090 [Pseudoalteromonas neustonica]|uniref:O-antigen ligase family protein n=1 Tax=Pseudoalteromonas neustonica TaxID=1840331 RepID=A0ABU9U0C6_9GAMM